MRPKIKLAVSFACTLGACIILSLNSVFSPAKLFRNIFNLYTGNESRDLSRAESGLYNLSCPLLSPAFLQGPSTVEANLHAVESGVLSIVSRAFQGKGHRKIVLAGDSNARQIFTSLSCLTRTLGIWKDDNAYAAHFFNDEATRQFNDARLMLRNGSEVFFSPTAGKVQSYGWHRQANAMQGIEDWLESCHQSKPFYLDTLSYDAPNKKVFFDPNDNVFEKVTLDEEDVVFFNSGLHGSRKENQSNLVALLNCMQDARKQGKHVNWPRLYYVRSNMQHFQCESGLYNKHLANKGETTCKEYVDQQTNPWVKEDNKTFTGKLPLVGFETDFSGWGSLHLGKLKGKTDCSHWTMPGVPDVFTREIAKELLKMN